ncbi:MAG TPA: hypothetical protein VF412_11495 [Bdellovibrio sp.]|uniref:hypothetical protein n=1 Tax=Bdellovibrio sp. TaxID=28201 RepID=UPI002EE6512F
MIRRFVQFAFIFTALPFYVQAGQSVSNRCESLFTVPELYTDSRLQGHELKQWKAEIAQRLNLPIEKISHKNFDGISDALAKLSPEQKDELLELVTTIYRDVSFNKYKDREYSHTKRVLDLIVSRTLDPISFFKKRIVEGKSPVEIYDAYLSLSLAKTGILTKYSGHDVLHFLRWVQNEIHRETYTDYDARTWRLVFYGSFFNGRAILHISDIDTIASSKSQDRFLQNLTDKYYFKRQPLDHVSSNSMEKFTIRNAAQINPIVFVVSQDAVEMRVYPEVRADELKDTTKPVEPLVFTIDGTKFTW